jgi:hypothetical protein
MLPSLSRLTEAPAVFEAADGSEVARLEHRASNTVALVGARCEGPCILTAPMAGTHGYAHIDMCDKKGTCRSAGGISVCVAVVASLHNRGTPVVFSAGYASVLLIAGAGAKGA